MNSWNSEEMILLLFRKILKIASILLRKKSSFPYHRPPWLNLQTKRKIEEVKLLSKLFLIRISDLVRVRSLQSRRKSIIARIIAIIDQIYQGKDPKMQKWFNLEKFPSTKIKFKVQFGPDARDLMKPSRDNFNRYCSIFISFQFRQILHSQLCIKSIQMEVSIMDALTLEGIKDLVQDSISIK